MSVKWIVSICGVSSERVGRSTIFGLMLVTLCALFVGGCGFKLRGSQIDAASLPGVYIHSERGSQLSVELYRVFHQAGIEMIEQRDLAVWVLTLSDERRERRVLSVGSSGKVQEYELYYGVYYSLQDNDGQTLLDHQPLTLLRDFSFSGSDVLAKADEEALLYQGMQQQAAQMILRRLLSQSKTSDVVRDKAIVSEMP